MSDQADTKPYTMHEAKTHLSRLVKAALDGKRVIIARGKQPLVELVAIEQQTARKPGGWKGSFALPDDFFAPLDGSELEAWYNSSDGLDETAA